MTNRTTRILETFGLEYAATWQQPGTKSFAYSPVEFPDHHAQPIAGFDYHVRITSSLPSSFNVGAKRWEMLLDSKRRALILTQGTDSLCAFVLDPVIAAARKYGTGPSSSGGTTIESQPAGLGTLFVTQLYGSEEHGLEIHNISAELYFKLRGR